jgi:hypothetical protein
MPGYIKPGIQYRSGGSMKSPLELAEVIAQVRSIISKHKQGPTRK